MKYRINMKNRYKYVSPLLMILLAGGCSVAVRSEASVGPVYVAYRIAITNREFPPDSYLTKINLYYNARDLLYVKNRNTFWLKHHDPVIVLTEKGMHVNFDYLPAAYRGESGEITLYFLPLAKGAINISGEILTKKKELYLGPRHKTVTRPIPCSRIFTGRSFTTNKRGPAEFFELARKYNMRHGTDISKGKHTNIYIPGEIPEDRAVRCLTGAVSARGFREIGAVRFPGGITRTFLLISPDKKQVVELRATVEKTGLGGNLHLFAYGNAGIDGHFNAIEARIRDFIAK